MSALTISPEEHVNPYREAAKKHVPAAGDCYAYRSPSYNGFEVVRLTEKTERGSWKCVSLLTGEESPRGTLDEQTLREYYRWISSDFGEVSALAELVIKGETAKVAALLGSAGEREQAPADSEALMATESPEHIAALLDASEALQNKLQEVQAVAKCMLEHRKHDLDQRLREMNGYLEKINEKVTNLLKVITVLNLYTGQTVDVNVIAEGDPAPADDPLCLRQRILFMDEELCVHLDHEGDYQDVPTFFDWLRQPANRDIIVPEPRCVVCLKPKRFNMNYRSGDPQYDAARNRWNKHTYVVIRNGENLSWFESEDLEVWKWAYPHEDFEEEYAEKIEKERKQWRDYIIKEKQNVTYRITKYMMFLQGLIDQRQNLVGPTAVRPNLMKLQGVRLIRDDENLIGTGRKPWQDFKSEKNALIRRGTRILYVAPPLHYDSWGHRNRAQTDGGDFVHYYSNDWSAPAYPDTGLYSVDEVETVHHHENGKPIYVKHPKLVFKYLPGDKVWDRTEFEERDRRRRVSWEYNPTHVLNYDTVTLEELTGYLEDRTLRESFAGMIPILVEMRRHKMEELRDEDAFKRLLSEDILKETGREPSRESIDEAVFWWKSKVIFTRALRSDDAKAWKMIRARVLRLNL